MMTRMVLPVLVVAFVFGCVTAEESSEGEIRVVGSDTMLELDRRLAESFMRAHPGATVRVEGGGSGVGIEALIEGRATIAAASRPLSSVEVSAIHEMHGTLGVRFLIAQDALSVYLNETNPVRDISLGRLRGIFEGSVTSWSAAGGGEHQVVVIVRPPSSGTHRFFRDHVLGGAPYTSRAVTAPTTRGVLEAVAGNHVAIGYGGLAYRRDGVIQVAVDGVAPTPENVGRGRYPLTRYLAFYTKEPPEDLARRFIDWCLSSDGQAVVADVGYVPLWRN